MNYISKYTTNPLTATVKVIYDKYYDYLYNSSFNSKTKRLKNDHSIITQYSYFFKDPIHIIDNIYLGSAYNAASYYTLKEDYKIKIIINATKEISNYYPDDFIYKNYDLADINEDSISKYLEDAYKIITNNNNSNILVHCFMGASRSASLVSYYIMKKYDVSLNDAINFIVEKRKIVNINTTFAQELNDSLINK